jgi:hypothetical protein
MVSTVFSSQVAMTGPVWQSGRSSRVRRDQSATGSRGTRTRLTPDQRNSFIAALLGWTMDAFDYFIVVLVYADIAADFGTSKEKVAFLTTATLLMRPVAFLVLIGKEAKGVEFGRSDTISEPVAAR